MLLPGQLGNPATIGIEWPGVGAARGEPVSGDRVIRLATAAMVCAVAAFAAVVSYSHIYGLGRAHGQDGTAARLRPLGHIDSLPAREPELAECRVADVSSLRAYPLTHAHGSQQ